MTNIQELLSKPVWQMTGEEFIFLSKHASGQAEALPATRYRHGKEVCVRNTRYSQTVRVQSAHCQPRIKKSGKIDKAITQIGRKIIVDAGIGS